MMDTLFGSAAPVWSAIPSPRFGLQSPIAIGNGPLTASIVPTFPAVAGLPSASPISSAFASPFVEPLANVTAPSLLAAVAMRRGQPQGPTNDQEVEDFVYDAFEMLPGTADVEVRCDGGRVTLSGSVQHKRLKRDVGEIVWAIPALHDVQNNVTIASRRRGRSQIETPQGGPGRKQQG